MTQTTNERSKPGLWKDYFKLVDSLDIPSDFMDDRKDLPIPQPSASLAFQP